MQRQDYTCYNDYCQEAYYGPSIFALFSPVALPFQALIATAPSAIPVPIPFGVE
jgi:hypothetical protein